VVPEAGRGQDAQYWTNQYGNRARLLAGAVIGSSDDLAAVAANIVQYTSYAVDIEGAEGSNIGSTKLGSAPSLFAGEINFKFLGNSRFAYSILTRYKADIRISEKRLITEETGPSLPGLDAAAADLLFEEDLTETWLGLTWSTPLGAHWGLGISPYLTIRGQRSNEQFTFQAIDTAELPELAVASQDRHRGPL
jgi:hypothetical protein